MARLNRQFLRTLRLASSDRRRALKLWLLLPCMLVVMVCSCNTQTVYSHFCHTDAKHWNREDTLVYALPKELKGTYTVELCVRATHTYPYRNIGLMLTESVGTEEKTKRINMLLTDNNGRSFGHRGTMYTEVSARIGRIQTDGRHAKTLWIVHNMKSEDIQGISDIGITLRH